MGPATSRGEMSTYEGHSLNMNSYYEKPPDEGNPEEFETFKNDYVRGCEIYGSYAPSNAVCRQISLVALILSAGLAIF